MTSPAGRTPLGAASARLLRSDDLRRAFQPSFWLCGILCRKKCIVKKCKSVGNLNTFPHFPGLLCKVRPVNALWFGLLQLEGFL